MVNILNAQENNYWYTQVGAESSLLGGVVIGGVDDPSANFYNPGASVFIEDSYIEAQADAASIDILHVKNATGENMNINSNQLTVVPQFFSYAHKFKGFEDLSFGISIITRKYSNLTYFEADNRKLEVVDSWPGDEYYQHYYEYNNYQRENWIAATFSYKLNEHLGVGLATNVVIYYSNYTKSLNIDTSGGFDGNNYTNTAYRNEEQKFSYRTVGLNLKPGINLRYEKFGIGLVITTPTLDMNFTNNSSYYKNNKSIPSINNVVDVNSHVQNKFNGYYKTPLTVDFGGNYIFRKFVIHAKVSWFSKIKPYQVLYQREDSKMSYYGDGNKNIPYMANKEVVNFGIALEYILSEQYTLACSYRTDKSSLDREALKKISSFVPQYADWDMNHVTLGFIRKGVRTDITFGANYGIGVKKNHEQLVNFTNPKDYTNLSGVVNNSATTIFQNISFNLGFRFNIDRIKGVNKSDI